jgi:hypothetical protein
LSSSSLWESEARVAGVFPFICLPCMAFEASFLNKFSKSILNLSEKHHKHF